jgi:prephenate dehydratase
MRVAYQGEPGAYGEVAAERVGTPVPVRTFEAVFDAVVTGAAELGALPLENTLGGSVHRNYDLLLRYPVAIVGETLVRIEHCVLGVPGAAVERARRVLSHPQALAQCEAWLARHPHLEPVAAYDTAGAAKALAAARDPGDLAIASERAARVYGLEVLARGVSTLPENQTRFAYVARRDRPPPALPAAPPRKVSLAFTVPHRRGALFRALAAFALRDVNLTKIESRPWVERPFEYLFYLDFEDTDPPEVGERAVAQLREFAGVVHWLGRYARVPEPPAPGPTPAAPG